MLNNDNRESKDNRVEKNQTNDSQHKSLDKMDKVERYKYYYDLLENDYSLAKYYMLKDKTYHSFHEYYNLVEETGKVDFLHEIEQYFPKLDGVQPSSLYKNSNKTIGIICDEFLYNSFKDVGNVIYIPYNYEEELIDFESLDYFIYATTWRGIDMSWEKSASPNNHKREDIYNIIKKIKSLGKPTVFYSKEDPVNYHLFKDVAQKCDYIFTSAEEMIERYKSLCNHNNVYSLQFGVNPQYHNPIGSRSSFAKKVKDEVIFAGSWLEKYPIRNSESQMIMNGVIKAEKELTIIDRNLNLGKERYLFPKRYIPYLTYPVGHEELMNIHKLYRFAINLNSVKYSNTMFANRVFELQAFGNILLSNYSLGLNNQFPNIFIINNQSDVESIMQNYSEGDYREFQGKAIRNVFRQHTTYDRIKQIESILFNENYVQQDHKILVVNYDESDHVINQHKRQLNVNSTLLEKSQVNDEIIRKYDFITFMSSKHEYGEYYLEDLITPFKFIDVNFVTKNQLGEVHNIIEDYKDLTTTMFKSESISSLKDIDKIKSGYLADDIEIEDNISFPNSTKELSVIVPIHNNGIYLEDKCFASLRRSDIFDKMEIIFINDGSTDLETVKIINRLRRRYPNHIVYYEFENGSGSASRPRNKGVELATSKYITYLDPDNEAMGQGYAKLFNKITSDSEIDMVVGNIMKEDNGKKSSFQYSKTVKKYNQGSPNITNTHKFMEASGLRAQSIQALIVKKEIIEKNDIRMIEGAAGQDTMFFQELMLHSNNVSVINVYIHMYYAAVAGSVTNTIGSKFFDKYYILEKERIPFLQKHNLLDAYMNERFNFYIKGWYMKRFDRIKPEERQEAITKFLDIYSLYDGFKRPEDIELSTQIKELKKEVNY